MKKSIYSKIVFLISGEEMKKKVGGCFSETRTHVWRKRCCNRIQGQSVRLRTGTSARLSVPASADL